MKKISQLFITLILSTSLLGQTSEKISYQAVIRDGNNNLIPNQTIGMKISVIQGSITGSLLYVETHLPISDLNGLVSIEIGAGTVVSGSFDSINFKNGPFFIQTESDLSGGTNYTLSNTSQLISTPYALHAKTAEKFSSNFYLGQDTLGGIVFYLYFDKNRKQHGLIVSKTEDSAAYQTVNTIFGASRSWDGAFNTNLLTSSPAANYATSLGTGWYLPSIDELILLYHNRLAVDEALSKGNFTLIKYDAFNFYWSSTELDSNYKLALDFSRGFQDRKQGSLIYKVRAIRSF